MSEDVSSQDGLRLSVGLQGLLTQVPLAIMLAHWGEEHFPSLVPQQQINVDLFIVIEGMLTARLLSLAGLAGSARKHAAERLVKIYPLFALSLLISLLLFLRSALGGGMQGDLQTSDLGLIGTSDLTVSEIMSIFWHNILFLPYLHRQGHTFPLNPPIWAIASEIYIFAVVCIAWRFLTPRRLGLFVAAIAIIYIAAVFKLHDVNMGHKLHHYKGGFPRCFYDFGMGMMLFHLVKSNRLAPPRVHPLIIWGVFAAMLFIRVNKAHEPFVGIPLAMIGMPLLVWLATNSPDPQWLKPVARQGWRLSYALYMLHSPLLMLCYAIADDLGMPPAWLMSTQYYLICLVVLVLISWATVLVIETLTRIITRRSSAPLKV